jgi:hypothetical protein
MCSTEENMQNWGSAQERVQEPSPSSWDLLPYGHYPRCPEDTVNVSEEEQLNEAGCLGRRSRDLALARQTTHNPPPAKGFKAGCLGQIGRRSDKIKRIIMEEMYDAGIFVVCVSWAALSKAQKSNRDNVLAQVRIASTLHVKTGEKNSSRALYMKGIVTSAFRDISATATLLLHPTLSNAAWDEADLDTSRRLMVCDVEWTKHTLTDDLKTYLNKVIKKGGGLTRTQGSLIPLA